MSETALFKMPRSPSRRLELELTSATDSKAFFKDFLHALDTEDILFEACESRDPHDIETLEYALAYVVAMLEGRFEDSLDHALKNLVYYRQHPEKAKFRYGEDDQ